MVVDGRFMYLVLGIARRTARQLGGYCIAEGAGSDAVVVIISRSNSHSDGREDCED